jgi:hypothetical protein
MTDVNVLPTKCCLLSVTVAGYLPDTKLSLEKPPHWREDCCITRSGLEHRRC